MTENEVIDYVEEYARTHTGFFVYRPPEPDQIEFIVDALTFKWNMKDKFMTVYKDEQMVCLLGEDASLDFLHIITPMEEIQKAKNRRN